MLVNDSSFQDTFEYASLWLDHFKMRGRKNPNKKVDILID